MKSFFGHLACLLIILAVRFMWGLNGTMTAAASLFIPVVIGFV